MKRAKEQFDSLVEKIQAGEDVSFGQMERVYAEAFLGKFLERVSHKEEQTRMGDQANSTFVDHDIVEAYYQEYGDVPQLSSSQLTDYALQLTSMMSGVLGVRASTEQLSSFVEKAVRDQDWGLLEKTLALSEEGELGKGMIQDVALNLLRSGSRAYEGLKEKFGEISFDAEQVTKIYEDLLAKGSTNPVRAVREATGVAVPEEMAQKSYRDYLSKEKRSPVTQVFLKSVSKMIADLDKKYGENEAKINALRKELDL